MTIETPRYFFKLLGVDDPKYRALDIPIPFEDEGVKAKVVERYGGITGGYTQVPGMRGEITYRQAMGIDSINFYTVYLGGPFNELRFFRKIKSLTGSLYNCGVKSLIIPEGVTSIGMNSLRMNNCYVEIPSTVTNIQNFNFYQGSYVVKIYATTPPTNVGGAAAITKLMVPQASLTTYQQDASWNTAGEIEGF